jgi:hypothetical protein
VHGDDLSTNGKDGPVRPGPRGDYDGPHVHELAVELKEHVPLRVEKL